MSKKKMVTGSPTKLLAVSQYVGQSIIILKSNAKSQKNKNKNKNKNKKKVAKKKLNLPPAL